MTSLATERSHRIADAHPRPAVVWRDRVLKLVARAVGYVVLAVFAGFTLLPLVWLVGLASRSGIEIMTIPPRLFPSQFLLVKNLADALSYSSFLTWLRNSLILVVVLATTDNLVSSLAGYALARFEFPGRQVFFYFILGTLMISFIVIIVPLYILVKELGWLNTYLGMMAPAFVSAFGVFFMRQYCLSVPTEYLDAARIDGASELAIYRRVVLPMIKPAVVTLVIFRFQWEWSSLLWPLLVAGIPNLRTIPLGLAIMAEETIYRHGGSGAQYSYATVLAANLLAVAPVVVVFLFLRRYFISGMITSGLKL